MPNYALISIPAYYILTMTPHALSVMHLSRCHPSSSPSPSSHKSRPPKYDNANPRGTSFSAKLASLTPRDRATFERLRAAHANMLENMAFYVGAVLAGVVAGVEESWLNAVLAGYLGSRVLYLGLYGAVEGGQGPWGRTAVFNVGCVALLGVYWKAAVAMGRG